MTKRLGKISFFSALALAGLYVLLSWISAAGGPSSEPGYNLGDFGMLPVSSEGRVKPIDSAARDTLDVFSGRETVKTEAGEKPAIKWMLDAIAQPNVGQSDPIFRINDPGILNVLGKQTGDQKYFSFADLKPHMDTIQQQARQANEMPSEQRNRFQRSVLELFSHVNQYRSLRALASPYVVAPTTVEQTWQPFNEVAAEQHATTQPATMNQSVRSFSNMLHAYHSDNPQAFNSAVADYRSYLQGLMPEAISTARLEVLLLNRFSPFYQATILCIGIFLLGCLSWVGWSVGWLPPLRNAALGVALVVVGLVTFGLLARIYIQGRPPVTNLYSSALFIGWGCLLLGLGVEWIYRNSIGLVAAAMGGFTTFVVALNLESGDTMGMMQAVLDTNFWLATHVTTVTIGYSTTFFAGALGILFIVLGLIASVLNEQRRQALMRINKQNIAKMIYGIVCFALLFSFVGTVLGGIWADQSWGRFWGWDPKENGAALIVLMNAMILHARWGGMIKERGMAVLAVCGNIITSWSWFGTNLLGVGLHSYGFMDSGVFWLGLFVLSQMFFIGLGLFPLYAWEAGGRVAKRPTQAAQTEMPNPSAPPRTGPAAT
jgi:ABC-type transport system involved in cytochrome c biogenesis permease subunit